jgi:hypothetical protein
MEVLNTTFVKSRNQFFRVSKNHANTFSAFWNLINRLERRRGSYISSRRESLRSHNLPSGRLKKWRCWRWWSDASRWTNFLHPVRPKKRLGRIRESDVLSRRMDLWSHNLPLVRFKIFFGEVGIAMFQGVWRPSLLIFCILGEQKSDLGEVAEVIISK